MTESVSKATGLEALLADMGLGWITKGTCNAGDIRVHFEGRSLPREGVSLFADQMAGGKLVGHAFAEGGERKVLALPRLVTKASFIKQLLSKSFWSSTWGRCLYVAGFALALLARNQAAAAKAMNKKEF